MKNKRIVFFFQHFPPFPGAGSRRAYSIISPLNDVCKSTGLQVDVITTSKVVEKNNSIKFHKVISSKKGNKDKYLKRIIYEFLTGINSCILLTFKIKKPDLIIISCPSYISFLIISIYSRLRGIDYALEIRDIYPEVLKYSGMIKQKFVYNFFNIITRSIYNHSKLIICSNKKIEKNIESKINHKRIKTVFNGFPYEIIELSKEKYKKTTIVIHGVMGVFQDVITLKKVIGALNNEDVNIIAIGYGPKENILKNISQSNFQFLGRKSLDETLKIVAKCHIGLSLRNDDYISKNSFPVKNWEYLGAAIPTINTPESEAAHFCIDNKIGYMFESGDLYSIVNTIKKIISNRNLLEIQSKNCKSIRENYSRNITGKNALELFINLI